MGRAAAESRAGREPVRPCHTRLHKCWHWNRSAAASRNERNGLTFRDVFLCHAWDDRKGAAKDLYDLLVSRGVKVWFSETDAGLGTPLLRAIDKGLANSRVGIVLVTPALLRRLPHESIADKELSVLLAGNRLVPVVHETTYEELREVSPMLASRTGLSTAEDTMPIVADKLAELVAP